MSHRWDLAIPFATMAPIAVRKNAHSTSTTPKNPRLVPLARAAVARGLVRCLLARLGPREFPPPLRYRRNPHLHRSVHQQRASDFEPSSLIDTDRHRLDLRCSRSLDFRPPFNRRHRISFRLHHPALGPFTLALPRRPALHPALVARPPWLRPSRLEVTIRHPPARPDRLAVRHTRPKPQFRGERSLPASFVRPRSHAPLHHFPIPCLRSLFPRARTLQPPVSASSGSRRQPVTKPHQRAYNIPSEHSVGSGAS
jgi:hypothetical protein